MREEVEVTLLATSLYKAIESRNIRDVTKILHGSKVNPNAIIPSKGISPFHLASGSENDIFAEEVTKLLLQFGGHPNIRSLDGMTPVHISAAWGRTNLLHLLLLNGGDPWVVDDEGNDAFDYAYQGQHVCTIELLDRYLKFESKYLNQSDTTPKYKMTLDKVLLYNSNAVVVYKTDNQCAPTQSYQLKCATTQTSPRDNLLPCRDIDVAVSTNKSNLVNCVRGDVEKKLNSVLADLKDQNVTLRRRKPRNYCKSNAHEENKVPIQVEKETGFNVSEKSLCDELQEQLFESGGTSKMYQHFEDKYSRSHNCAIKTWQLNSTRKTPISSSVPKMTFMDELKKQQSKIRFQHMKSANYSESDLNKDVDTVPTRVRKYTTKQGDTQHDENFIQDSREQQGDDVKHVHPRDCAYQHWMEELKARQAEGLKENLKQLSHQSCRTELVMDEVMVQVIPSSADHVVSPLEIDKTFPDMEQECSITVSRLLETNPTVDSSMGEDDAKEHESPQQVKDRLSKSVVLPLHDIDHERYKSKISFYQLYDFTLEDSDTSCKDTFPESEAGVYSSSANTVSILANYSVESDSTRLQPCEQIGLKNDLLPVDACSAVTDVETLVALLPEKCNIRKSEEVCLPEEPYPSRTVHEIEVANVSESGSQREDGEQKSVSSLHLPQRIDTSLNSEEISPCLVDPTEQTNHLGVHIEPQISFSSLRPGDQSCEDFKDVHSEDIVVQSHSEKTGKHNIEENVCHQLDRIQSSNETSNYQFENLFHNISTSTRKHLLDLDDWMTMDWMDHDGLLNISELEFDDEIKCVTSHDSALHSEGAREQERPSVDASKSLRSSPEYFTCNEEIQTLARYPSGKSNNTKILFPGNTTITSLPNLSVENHNTCSSTSRVHPKVRENELLSETKTHEKTSFEPLKTTNLHDVTASSVSDVESFVSVSEDYIYTDEEEGVVLLERRYLVPESCRSSSEGSASGASSSGGSYDTDTLRSELKRRGLNPGPIIPSTKKVYVKKLRRLARNPQVLPKNFRVYSSELEKTLRKEDWHLDLSEYEGLERQMAAQFSVSDSTRVWRQGVVKSSFCYLLLDPRVTCNLPCRTESTPRAQIWSSFLEGIFYVGKGKRSRPYSHLYQAVSVWKTGATSSDPKIQRILNIWKDGVGVVCLHIFQNTIPVEAFTREAAMIDALMLHNLKNSRRSEYYGIAATWTLHSKKMLGTYLLYRAMMIFLNEGERQLQPADIGH